MLHLFFCFFLWWLFDILLLGKGINKGLRSFSIQAFKPFLHSNLHSFFYFLGTFGLPSSSQAFYMFLPMSPKKKMARLWFRALTPFQILLRGKRGWNIPSSRILFEGGFECSCRGKTFEVVGFESTGSGTPLSHNAYRTLLRDNDDGEGSIIGQRSILRMWVEREEVLWCNNRFECKAQPHHFFDKWAGRIVIYPVSRSCSTNWLFERPSFRQGPCLSTGIKWTCSFWFHDMVIHNFVASLGELARRWKRWQFWHHCRCSEMPMPYRRPSRERTKRDWTFWINLCLTRSMLPTKLPTWPRPSSSIFSSYLEDGIHI